MFLEKEGVSLNQFIDVAVAEKLAHLERGDRARKRKQPTKELTARALDLLDEASQQARGTGRRIAEGLPG